MKRRLHLCIFVFALIALVGQAPAAAAATNIVSSPGTSHWAWNDVIGWLDFYTTNTVNVAASALTGYATSSAGAIALDCATSPAGGNLCANQYQVLNDGAGRLSGWAWNDAVGWISFCGGQGADANCPGTVSYRVLIDGATGDFSGWAWNDAVGWISFCGGQGADANCPGTITYKVTTAWAATSTTGYVDSSTFDTAITGGAQINSVLWHGSKPSGSFVGFQFAAAATSTGPWHYAGPDGTSATYYGTTNDPGTSIPVSYTLYNDSRFFRYRMTLSTTVTQSASPQVDDVSVNWSR